MYNTIHILKSKFLKISLFCEKQSRSQNRQKKKTIVGIILTVYISTVLSLPDMISVYLFDSDMGFVFSQVTCIFTCT